MLPPARDPSLLTAWGLADGEGEHQQERQRRDRNQQGWTVPCPAQHFKPLLGTCYLHTVIDDHSRVAYVEARDDETKESAAEVLRHAVAWFAERGVTVQRVRDRQRCGPRRRAAVCR